MNLHIYNVNEGLLLLSKFSVNLFSIILFSVILFSIILFSKNLSFKNFLYFFLLYQIYTCRLHSRFAAAVYLPVHGLIILHILAMPSSASQIKNRAHQERFSLIFNMAGSQLKQLKAALKEKGLTGQTNVKKNKKNARTGKDIKRDDKEQILSGIRSQFNKFDTRTNRTKHDYTVIEGRKFVKAGLSKSNNTSRSKSKVQQALEGQYRLTKSRFGKTGGVIDKRFGESNKGMTQEEKMLARFTKERERLAKKNVFSLDNDSGDDDEDDGFQLTHYGKSLSLNDDDDETERKRNRDLVDLEELELMPGSQREGGEGDAPARKKSKAEVMKEIIAKSKFYKHQRQQENQKTQNEILDLDDDFENVMQDLNTTLAANKAVAPTIVPKTQEQIDYDQKVRELTFDRRSVPADRSKTAEELAKDHNERMKKLETDRLNRMHGMDENRDAEGDDLGDEFWDGSADEIEPEEEDLDVEESDADVVHSEVGTGRKPKTPQSVSMPNSHEEFAANVLSIPLAKHSSYVDKVCELYHPRLGEGNKEKMQAFVGILFEHALFLAEQPGDQSSQLFELYVKKVKSLGEKYNEGLVTVVREKLDDMEKLNTDEDLSVSDLVVFAIIGVLFSTSDHHHLIVTPSILLMNKHISKLQHVQKDIRYSTACQTSFLIDVVFNYTSFSKRIDPEVINLLEKLFLILVPEPLHMKANSSSLQFNLENTSLNIPKSYKGNSSNKNVSFLISQFLNTDIPKDEEKFVLLEKLISILDKYLDTWKESSAFAEIVSPFIIILKHLAKYFSSELNIGKILNKASKLASNSLKDRKPLTLQHHRALAIATFTPKFEENFNPDKKSYDVNRERQEVNKMKAQLKKEKKSALKDIRKESRFVARENIKEKKATYEAYHKKMASIVNSISTIEGAEKNSYEREKKERKGRK